jgi:hypothetical protein
MSQGDTTGARHAQPCGGADNDHDGCGVIFPQMSPEALLCQLCKKLKKQGLTEDEVLRLKVLISQTEMLLDSDQTVPGDIEAMLSMWYLWDTHW